MTEEGYFAAPAAPAAPAVWRVVLTVLATVLGGLAAPIAAFAGVIIWSGCFMGCAPGGGDHVTGGLLGLLTVGLLGAGPVLARVLLRSGRAVACAVGGVVGVIGLFVLLSFG